MASYNWKKLNSDIVIKDVRKKLFNQYYYSIKYYCPGGRIILRPNITTFEDIDNAVSSRIHYNKFFFNTMYTGCDYQSANYEYTKDISSHQLLDILQVKNRYKNDVKLRIVEPYVTFYASTEDILFKIADVDLYAWSSYLSEMCKPKSDSLKNLLDKNVIFVKKDTGFRYKFMCKEGACRNKTAIYSYLDQLGDQVKISKTVWTLLESTSAYIYNAWFYCNDAEIAQMLNIIEPNFISNIHELVVV